MTAASAIDDRTAVAIREAVLAARSGRIDQACAIGERALADGGDPVALNAMLGMLRCRNGEFDAGIQHLRLAHEARPDDTTIALNLVTALAQRGSQAEALDVASMELARADPTLSIARHRGFLAQALENFPAAIEAYEHVVAAAPSDWETWNNLGNARAGMGDAKGSVAALERAVAINPESPPTRLNFARALSGADRADEAEEILRAMVRDFPDDSHPRHELYVLYKHMGRDAEAMPEIEEAVRLDPDNANLQLKLGVECGLVMRIEDAERAFRKAVSIEPTMVDAYLGLVIQYEHTNREEEFAPLIALAERNRLDEGALAFMRAMEHRRAGRFEEALECLGRVPPEIEPERAAHLKGTLLDRLGRSDEAFDAFVETGRLHAAHPTQPLKRGAELREQLRGEVDRLTPEWLASWSKANPPSTRPAPVFLVGFPRSGTTLLDTILMGHPRAQVMEEKPPLNLVDLAIGGFDGIARLDEAGMVRAREQYFEEAGKICDLGDSDVLIDKSPLFLHKVPLIHRLFPDARFILALRHPADVVLSCFMSNFRLNPAMSNFLRVEDAAALYDVTFDYWERARALLPINVHTVVYERMIDDLEGEIRPLLEYLELDWHDGMLDHQRTAATRGLITTASYSQVTEPIYTRASGRWERYRKHLEPILPVLAPWAEKFGYTI
jgi:tetratricopeptide (TPR) repeat protein